MNDDQADAVLVAVLELAVRVRDETGPRVADAARDVLKAAGGDVVAALTVAAALVAVERPLDMWWQEPLREGRPLAPCGTSSAYKRHKKYGEEPDNACRLAYRTAERDRRRARKGRAA